MNFKYLLFPILLILLILTLSATADVVIKEFLGTPSGDKITLKWKTDQEDNINLYIIERSQDQQIFVSVGEVVPKGNGSEYEFIDRDLTKVNSIYYYRLKIRRTDATFQISDVIAIIPNISSFAKTWGSIKALFQ